MIRWGAERVRGMEWEIHRFDEIGSTNDEAAAAGARGESAGWTAVARRQTAGHGRLGREWYSPMDAGLYVSVLVRPEISPEAVGLLSLCAGNAALYAVRKAGLKEAGIKWPNDLVIHGKKMCGILSVCRAGERGIEWAVIGTGINLLPGAYPKEIADRATSLSEEGVEADREQVLADYLEELGRQIEKLEKGAEYVLEDLRKNCVTIGQKVVVSGGTDARGTAAGIGPGGELVLETEDGETLHVTAGDVSVRTDGGYA